MRAIPIQPPHFLSCLDCSGTLLQEFLSPYIHPVFPGLCGLWPEVINIFYYFYMSSPFRHLLIVAIPITRICSEPPQNGVPA